MLLFLRIKIEKMEIKVLGAGCAGCKVLHETVKQAVAELGSVPLAVIFGVPMYANAAGVVPIIQVFVDKGVPLGTTIAFMMAVVGLSLPEATLLKKVMTWCLIGIFFAVVALFIVLSGYLFNLVL